jgi:hypothetical protein
MEWRDIYFATSRGGVVSQRAFGPDHFSFPLLRMAYRRLPGRPLSGMRVSRHGMDKLVNTVYLAQKHDKKLERQTVDNRARFHEAKSRARYVAKLDNGANRWRRHSQHKVPYYAAYFSFARMSKSR